jgi:uncharacterized membrane protein
MQELTHKKSIIMHKGRIEAFSDGVLAIIITIMVLELKTPQTANISELIHLVPVLISYILSFIYIGIYWNNHHHLFQIVKQVNGSILWANLHVLFWLSLLPFVTAWSGENSFSKIPVALYGVILFMAAIAYFILAKLLIASHGKDSDLAKSIGNDSKGKISIIIYGIAIPLTFISQYIGLFLYLFVALIWIKPDKRVEKEIE